MPRSCEHSRMAGPTSYLFNQHIKAAAFWRPIKADLLCIIVILFNLLMKLKPQLSTGVVTPDKYLSVLGLVRCRRFRLIETLLRGALFHHQIEAARVFFLRLGFLKLLHFDLLLCQNLCINVNLMLWLNLDLVVAVHRLVQVDIMVWIQSLSVSVYLLNEINLCVLTLTLMVFFALIFSFSFIHSCMLFSKVFSIMHSVAMSVSHSLHTLRNWRIWSCMDIFCFIILIINMFFVFNSVVGVCVLVTHVLTLTLWLSSWVLLDIQGSWCCKLAQVESLAHGHIIDRHHSLGSVVAYVIVLISSSRNRRCSVPHHCFSLFAQRRFTLLISLWVTEIGILWKRLIILELELVFSALLELLFLCLLTLIFIIIHKSNNLPWILSLTKWLLSICHLLINHFTMRHLREQQFLFIDIFFERELMIFSAWVLNIRSISRLILSRVWLPLVLDDFLLVLNLIDQLLLVRSHDVGYVEIRVCAVDLFGVGTLLLLKVCCELRDWRNGALESFLLRWIDCLNYVSIKHLLELESIVVSHVVDVFIMQHVIGSFRPVVLNNFLGWWIAIFNLILNLLSSEQIPLEVFTWILLFIFIIQILWVQISKFWVSWCFIFNFIIGCKWFPTSHSLSCIWLRLRVSRHWLSTMRWWWLPLVWAPIRVPIIRHHLLPLHFFIFDRRLHLLSAFTFLRLFFFRSNLLLFPTLQLLHPLMQQVWQVRFIILLFLFVCCRLACCTWLWSYFDVVFLIHVWN